MDFKERAEKLGLEEEEYSELLGLFIETGISDLEKLKNAIEGRDAEQAANVAHSLKGASGNLGLSDFYEIAKKIELDARNGNLEKIGGAVEALRKNLDEMSMESA